MIWKLFFLFIFLLPLIVYAHLIYILIRERRRAFLLLSGFSSICSGLLYAFVFSRFEYPLIEIYSVLIAALFVKAYFSESNGEKVKKRKFIMPVLTLVSTFYVIAEEYKHQPETGYNLSRPIQTEEGEALIVGKGGNTILFNHHIVDKRQSYAVDVAMKIGFFDTWGMLTGDASDFTIFGKEILSPCRGTVISARLSLEDQVPGETLESTPEGNAIELECKGSNGKAYIFRYAHLKQNSSGLKVGDEIEKGAILGKVGNTGNTSWPHLHIDVIEKDSQQAVPIFFGGKFLRAGEVLP